MDKKHWAALLCVLLQLSFIRISECTNEDLVVLNLPKVVIHASSAFILRNEKVNLECVIESPEDDGGRFQVKSITWFCDGQEIKVYGRRSAFHRDRYRSKEPSLRRIELLGQKRSSTLKGDYACLVEFVNHGTVRSPLLKLRPAGIRKFPRNLISKTVEVVEGNTAFIRCNPPQSHPDPPDILWKWNRTETILTNNEKYLIGSHGLHIRDASLQDSGQYRCIARNKISGQARRSSVYTELAVISRPLADQTPSLKFPDRKITQVVSTVGSNVTLECVVTGFPVPYTRWEKYKENLPNGRHEKRFDSLFLRDLRKSDEGSYLCRPVSRGHLIPDEQSFIVYKLFVEEPLKASISVKAQEKNEEVVTISCTASKEAKLIWLFDGSDLFSQDIQRKDVDYDNEKRTFALTLPYPQRSGAYQCMVERKDEASAEAVYISSEAVNKEFFKYTETPVSKTTAGIEPSLEVSKSETHLVPIIDIPPEDTRAHVGTTVLLQCNVLRYTTVKWLKDEEPLPIQMDDRMTVYGSGSVHISNLRKEDSGKYTCWAQNPVGNVSASAILTVDERSTPWDEPKPAEDNANTEDSYEDSSTTSDGLWQDRFEAPIVHPMSDHSVLLTWKIPDDLLSSVSFIKIQYKIATKESPWQTVRQQLFPHATSHSIHNLHTNVRYRFRIVVMLKSNEQAISKVSKKFLMKAAEVKIQAPLVGPLILETQTLSSGAIEVKWDVPPLESAPIDGFIIQFREHLEGQTSNYYFNATVDGGSTREHVLDSLLPERQYEIAVQSFNQAGRSPLSSVARASTQSTSTFGMNFSSVLKGPRNESSLQSRHAQYDEAYIPLTTRHLEFDAHFIVTAVGGALGFVLFSLVVVLSACQLQKRRRKKILLAAKGKFEDTSKKIYKEYSINKNLMNGSVCATGPTGYSGLTANGLTTVNMYHNPINNETTQEEYEEEFLEQVLCDREGIEESYPLNMGDFDVSGGRPGTPVPVVVTKQAPAESNSGVLVAGSCDAFLHNPSFNAVQMCHSSSMPRRNISAASRDSSSPHSDVIQSMQFFTFKPSRSPALISDAQYSDYVSEGCASDA